MTTQLSKLSRRVTPNDRARLLDGIAAGKVFHTLTGDWRSLRRWGTEPSGMHSKAPVSSRLMAELVKDGLIRLDEHGVWQLTPSDSEVA